MKPILIFAALAVATLQAPAFASDGGSETVSQIVEYRDLDLTRSEDRRTLDRRIERTIRDLCGPVRAIDPAGRSEVQVCREQARLRVAPLREQALAESARDNRKRLAIRN